MNISFKTEYSTNPNKTQYVGQEDVNETTRYITGEIDQQPLSATLRVNYTINPNLTIQYYGQPFIAKGRYSNFNFVTVAAALDINERVQLYNDSQILFEDGSYLVYENIDDAADYSFDATDFTVLPYRSKLVIRWEYISGSELFAVWSQGVNGFIENDARKGFKRLLIINCLTPSQRIHF